MSAFILCTPLSRTHIPIHGRPVCAPALPQSYQPVYQPRTTPVVSLLSVETLPSVIPLTSNPAFLDTIATAFGTLNMPKWLVEWGHPAMMSIMVLAMGTPGAVVGWQGRLNDDKKKGIQQKQLHESIMIAFFLLAVLGGTGGTLSVAMQGYDVWQSPHFLSAMLVLIMLALNSVMAYSGFTIGNDGSPKARLQGRKLHSYFGIAAMAAFLVHGVLGAGILLG